MCGKTWPVSFPNFSLSKDIVFEHFCPSFLLDMCVKTKRLDVAEVCLANMGNARGTRSLREAKKEQQKEAQLAAVAIELGLYDEAEKLYTSVERYDLLNRLFQSRGDWKKS